MYIFVYNKNKLKRYII